MPSPKNSTTPPVSSGKDVRQALDAIAPKNVASESVSGGGGSKLRIVLYIAALLIFAAVYFLLRQHFIPVPQRFDPLARRMATGGMAAAIVLAVRKIIDLYLICRLDDAVARYNLRRIASLIGGLALALIAISILFANWYAAVASLGLISLVLGFALQTPITSFIGWIYLLTRKPYRVGDRIMIDGSAGDVIDVGYLDTTLWEVGGPLLSSEHPSGRLIKFPNAKVLNSIIFNYSWPLFPYVWNEVTFHVAYQSDLAFIAETMRDVVEKELGEDMLERVKSFRAILSETPVDEVNVRERPSVQFRVNDNTWLNATVRYVVPPKSAGTIKNRLIQSMLVRLNAEPDKVMFPNGNAR